jgi:crotonobetainyl-CoA:carnitine CoA-transferase CaiB-like acyl-CoA transferase
MGGLMSVTGEPDGEPMKAGVAMTDILTGMYAATAVLAALAHRERSGEGQRVDLALLDVQVATLANLAENYLVTGRAPDRHGNAHASIVPYQAFATQDGYVVVAVGNDGQFGRLCEVAARPELAADPRFATNAARVENRAALVPILQALLAGRPTRDWVVALEGAGVPCGPINDLAQVFEDPHVRDRGLRVEVPHPLAGSVPVVASPMRLSGTPVSHGTPPLLGEHTRDVLRDVLGMGEAEIETLRRERVI